MPSERKVIAFRPDDEEQAMVDFLAKRYGVPQTRALGIALRRIAEQEGFRHEEVRKEGKGETTQS